MRQRSRDPHLEASNDQPAALNDSTPYGEAVQSKQERGRNVVNGARVRTRSLLNWLAALTRPAPLIECFLFVERDDVAHYSTFIAGIGQVRDYTVCLIGMG